MKEQIMRVEVPYGNVFIPFKVHVYLVDGSVNFEGFDIENDDLARAFLDLEPQEISSILDSLRERVKTHLELQAALKDL